MRRSYGDYVPVVLPAACAYRHLNAASLGAADDEMPVRMMYAAGRSSSLVRINGLAVVRCFRLTPEG
jgi:hypothetical protein